MDLIVGGKAQGKREYMIKAYGLDAAAQAQICDGASCTPQELERAVYVDRFQEFVRRYPEYEPKLREDAVVICDEVSSGIVPLQREERQWRENVGKAGCRVAAEARRVIRVVFGVPVRIK